MKSFRLILKAATVCILSIFIDPHTVAAQPATTDSVTITGSVSDYEGCAIGGCSVMFLDTNFDVLAETKTNSEGLYSIKIPKGRYSSMSAIKMDTYPHTMKPGTADKDLRLEFWGWNFIADKDTCVNIRYHRMEAYGLHAFRIPGGMPTYQIYVRPMSLTRFLASTEVEKAQHKQVLSATDQQAASENARCDGMAPEIDRADIKVWIDGEEVPILMKQQVKEYYEADEYGIGYYLTVNEPQRSTSRPYRVFKIELTDLENGDKGEAIYYLEKNDYMER